MQRRSPSLRDGLKAEQVVAIKQTAIATIIETGQRLNIDIFGVYTALVFFHKFYESKSLVRNDPFLMSVACLYLGGKVEDTPKSVRDVLVASCELRYGLESARRISHDKALYESLREKVFIAERALLYALDFDFAVQHAAKPLFEMWQKEPLCSFRQGLRDVQKEKQLVQLAYTLSNDCYKTEACLRFSGTALAAACIWLAMKLLKLDTHIYTEAGQLWWVAADVSEEDLEGVEDCLQELYVPNLYATYSDNDLVLQSAQILKPDQAAAAAAAAAGPPPPHAAAALPADIAAANRESWAAVGAAPPLPPAAAPALPQPPAEAAPMSLPDLPPAAVVQQKVQQQQQGSQPEQQQAAAAAAMDDDGPEDYDELFDGLG
ncbi:hypothetical protein ABPG75_002907 [Micractinium tetrahymenae]